MSRSSFKRLLAASVAAASGLACGGVEVLETLPWIGDGRPAREGAAWYRDDPAPEFRAEFVLSKGAAVGPDGLKLHLATPGYARVAVNGSSDSPLGIGEVLPLWSPVGKTIYAETISVPRKKVRPYPATNRVTVTLGGGWYDMPPLRFWGGIPFRDHLPHGRPCFKLAVEGVKAPLAWTWRETDILQNSVQLGTTVDRTRAAPYAWKLAAAVRGPRGRIMPRLAPAFAVQADDARPGHAVWHKEGSVAVVDFGANMTGRAVFCFDNTTPGQRLEIIYGERLNADGSVNGLTQAAGQIKSPGKGGPGAPDVALQRDALVCRGAKREWFGPPFAWHVFRYAEIRGLRTLPTATLFVPVGSRVRAVRPGASFAPKNGDFLRLHEMCVRTFRDNLVGVQCDCPGRERLGYGGDIVATCEAMMLNFDMKEFYLKTLQDFADEAADDGWITETAPYVGIGGGDGHGAYGASKRAGPISWTLAVPVLMDGVIRHYPDAKDRALAFYPVCARYVALMEKTYPGGIIPNCIGDHEALERAPNEVTATAHWHEFVRLTATFAKMLGKAGDAARFEELAAKIKAAFVGKYVKDGVVANGTQSAQAIALYLGLVPQEQVAAAEARLVKAIEEKGFAPSTGLFSTRYMLMYLSAHGRRDLAEKVVLHKGFPGWLHMLERGATTLWETWKESDDVFSNCHPMFGSVDEWLLTCTAR